MKNETQPKLILGFKNFVYKCKTNYVINLLKLDHENKYKNILL